MQGLRVSRGTALLFYRTLGNRWGGVNPSPRAPLSLANTRYPLYRRLGGLQGRSGRTENLVPTGIRSRTVQPVVIRWNMLLILSLLKKAFLILALCEEALINKSVFFLWRCDPTRAMASSFLRLLDHTQRRITVGRTPLDAWWERRRDLYLTTHNTHKRQTSMPLVGFEPTVSAGERPQSYALDRAATGIGCSLISIIK